MAVEDLQCPNCGASIDFAGSNQATCPFCRSQLHLTQDGVKAASTLNDLLENQPATTQVDRERIQELVREGKKIEAIKLVREQTDLGLKDAKDVVEAIERGETPELKPRVATPTHDASQVDLDQITELLLQGKKLEAVKVYRAQTGADLQEALHAVEAIEESGSPVSAIKHTPAQPIRQKNSSVGCLLGCLPMLLFFGVCAGFIMLSSQVMFRAFGPLGQVLQIVNSNPTVVQALGRPLTPGAFVTGEINGGGSASSAEFSLPLYGSKHSGDLNVSGEWHRGVWDLNIWVVYEEGGEEQTIHITQKVK